MLREVIVGSAAKYTSHDRELAPATALAPKIDITRPDGDIANVRFVVRRDDVRHPYSHGLATSTWGSSFNAMLFEQSADYPELVGLPLVGERTVDRTGIAVLMAA